MRILYVSFVIVIIDQLSKIYVKGFSIPFLNFIHKGMYEGERINVIGNFFRITFIENPGMAFGFDPGLNMKLWVSVFSLVASIGLIVYLYKIRDQHISLRLSIAFILGGAIGNLIDRMFYGIFYHYAPLFYGRVVDFLDFDFFHFSLFGHDYNRWPIFNIADASVTTGVLILLIFYKKIQKEKEDQEELAINDGVLTSDQIPANQNNGNSVLDSLESKEETYTESKDDKNGETDNGKKIPL